MGMIRSCHNHRIKGITRLIEHLAKITKALGVRIRGIGTGGYRVIHVAQGDNIFRRAGVNIGAAHAADPNGGDIEPFIGRNAPGNDPRRISANRMGTEYRSGSGNGQKRTPRQVFFFHRFVPFKAAR
ncbi:MAG: hypothetical protein BWY09_02794 [Candidatus Hydrogenedentes bacterium ADurb.Bin179]|nr:MAG: hypothetical protein BWY09_02794 [Candidatus Hydrogenedentes bacterium ADurb.Bin179]